jgi:hypothetical protein
MIRTLHFVWLGQELPVVRFLHRTVADLYPGWPVRVWTGPPEDWPPAWQAAYDRAPDHARRADILRLWALTSEGGVYYDSDFAGRAPLPPEILEAPFACGFLPICNDQDARICWRGVVGIAANSLIVADRRSPVLAELVALALAATPDAWMSYGSRPMARVWSRHRFPLMPPEALFPGWDTRRQPGAPERAWHHAFHADTLEGECATHLWLRGSQYALAQEWYDRDRAELTLRR